MLGNVFSPHYARARRDGSVVDPLAHCTMNVVLHGPSGDRFALTERGRESVCRSATELVIGPSAMRWEGDALVIDLEEATARFPNPVAKAVRGTITLWPEHDGASPVALDGAGRHAWWPVATSARVEVDLKDPSVRWKGHGYHDANTGDRPLEQDFLGWNWSRTHLGRDGVVLYDTELADGSRRLFGRRFGANGMVEPIDPPRWVELSRSGWGIGRATRCDAGASARVEATLLDAPFYARSVVSTKLLGHTVKAMHEAVDLRRFVKPWVQFLVPFKMRRG